LLSCKRRSILTYFQRKINKKISLMLDAPLDGSTLSTTLKTGALTAGFAWDRRCLILRKKFHRRSCCGRREVLSFSFRTFRCFFRRLHRQAQLLCSFSILFYLLVFPFVKWMYFSSRFLKKLSFRIFFFNSCSNSGLLKSDLGSCARLRKVGKFVISTL